LWRVAKNGVGYGKRRARRAVLLTTGHRACDWG
jgi:hypothetical protein